MYNFSLHDRVHKHNVQFYFVHDHAHKYNVQFYFVHDRLLKRKFMLLILRLSLRMAEVEETVVDMTQSNTHCVNASG
jgi:hypothetical protein